MKISAQEEYGLRCLVQLANLQGGESLTLPQIAEREGISTANAGKLMWLLNKAGFVQSTRGTKGGYFLSRPAADIRLSEIIKVLDEDVRPAARRWTSNSTPPTAKGCTGSTSTPRCSTGATAPKAR